MVAALGPRGAQARPPAGELELVNVIHAGGTIGGAVVHDGYLYMSTPDRLTIYSLEDPAAPQQQGVGVSPRLIHGELLSTNGELLLLNEQAVITENSAGLRTVDIWDVEDKSNPKLVGSVRGTPDEHVSCILDCTWAYGSEGSILDLRDPTRPKLRGEDWMDLAGAGARRRDLHRVDEYRPGFITSAPRGRAPAIYDVRDPLRPRLVARARYKQHGFTGFLFSDVPGAGRGRYLFSSIEYPGEGDCDDPSDGGVVAFDMKKRGMPQVSRFTTDNRDCVGFYFSFHPDFERTGLIVLPQRIFGVRVVRFQPGNMSEMAAFAPAITDMWLSFWVDRDFVYALSITGEIYILRYVA